MTRLEYCIAYKIYCPYLKEQTNSELKCLSEEKECKKWREILDSTPFLKKHLKNLKNGEK